MTNFGNPVIEIHDADYDRRNELLLVHAWEGRDLEINDASKTLKAVQSLWGRPVHLQTQIEGQASVITCNEDKKVEVKKIS